jgi:hypothetical protein
MGVGCVPASAGVETTQTINAESALRFIVAPLRAS